VTDQKSPIEQALDLVLYAPVGLALTAREELPRMIEKGRQRISGQVMLARMLGQFAVTQGQQEATKMARQAGAALIGLGILPGDRDGAAAPPAPTVADEPPAPAPPAHDATSNGSAEVAQAGPAPSSDDLAIPGYDSLSASQVVQRLAGLAPGELEAVRAYEASTRGRRTILNRVAQLQTGAS
jgi:hypothetical protein